MTGEVLRTPEERFAGLSGFPWQARYLDDLPGYAGLRMAYVDEGPPDALDVFLCLHGEPTWSYLYRKMIPHFLATGARVVAPDLFGFGRSDKPVGEAVYTFDFHRNALLALLERLDLRGITLVCQDWGGILGLTLPLDAAERFRRLLVMNTALPVGEAPSAGFIAWRDFARSSPDLAVGELMQRAEPRLSAQEAAAYDAPYPDVHYKAGVRRFPELVPVTPDMDGVDYCRRARRWWRDEWHGTSFMAVGMKDRVLGPDVMAALRETIRGCSPPMELTDAGHFVQEHGDVVAPAALAWFADNASASA